MLTTRTLKLFSGGISTRIVKCKQNIVKNNSVNDFINVYFYCFVQRHVTALVMSHLQVDYFL
jgi:hypothetical protein